jgi:hypothetical protein
LAAGLRNRPPAGAGLSALAARSQLPSALVRRAHAARVTPVRLGLAPRAENFFFPLVASTFQRFDASTLQIAGISFTF